jgi:hypothetical protein
MPSSQANAAKLAALKAANALVPVSTNSAPVNTQAPPPYSEYIPLPNASLRTTLPSASVLQPDTVRTFTKPNLAQTRTQPPVASASPNIGAAAASQTTVLIEQGEAGPSFKTNNILNAVQSSLNLISGTGITLTPNAFGGVQIASNASATPSLPGFWAYTSDSIGNTAPTNWINGANGVGGNLIYIPWGISTGHMQFDVTGADTVPNSYDVGIYGPFIAGATSVSLLANSGPKTYTTTGIKTIAWLQGTVTLTAGFYFMFWTSSGSGSLPLLLQGGITQIPYLYQAYSATTSVSSTLPTTVAVPTLSPTYPTGSGANTPQPFQFLLY